MARQEQVAGVCVFVCVVRSWQSVTGGELWGLTGFILDGTERPHWLPDVMKVWLLEKKYIQMCAGVHANGPQLLSD